VTALAAPAQATDETHASGALACFAHDDLDTDANIAAAPQQLDPGADIAAALHQLETAAVRARGLLPVRGDCVHWDASTHRWSDGCGGSSSGGSGGGFIVIGRAQDGAEHPVGPDDACHVT
jgi:hypothetical protein